MIIILIIVLFLSIILTFKIKFDIHVLVSDLNINYYINIKLFKLVKTFYKKDIDMWLKKRKEKRKGQTRSNSKNTFKLLKKYKEFFNVEKLELLSNIGLIDTMATVLAIPIISTFISSIFVFLNIEYSNNRKFIINPIFNKLTFTAKFDCILSIKIAHIIYVYLSYRFERRKKNGGSSYRKPYEYCYE